MDKPVLLIRHAAVLHARGRVDLAGDQQRVAEAAFSAAAARGGGDPVLFEDLQHGIVRAALDCARDARLRDGDLYRFRHAAGVVGLRGGVVELAEHLVADIFALKIQLLKLLVDELVHLLRTAEEYRIGLVGGSVLFDQLRGDEALFTTLFRFGGGVGEHVHDFEFIAVLFELGKLVREQDIRLVAAAVEQDQLKILVPVADRLRHG